jgi:hypothetical protein
MSICIEAELALEKLHLELEWETERKFSNAALEACIAAEQALENLREILQADVRNAGG